MSTSRISLLYSKEDIDILQPVLDALGLKGIRASEYRAAVHKGGTVLAVLSDSFIKTPDLTDSLLDLLGSSPELVIPLHLDSSSLPDELKNALYSRNIIFASERDTDLIAERIASALPKKKNRLPLILSVAGIILLSLIAVFIWQTTKADSSLVEIGSTGPLSIPENIGLTEEDLAKVKCVVIIGEHFTWYTQETRLYRQGGSWPDMLYELASFDRDTEDGRFEWYWHEDGSKVTITSYDLSFLSYMPELEELHMAKVKLDNAPDLSSLNKLNTVWVYDCELDDIEWLGGSMIRKAQIRCDVDYTPLSRCSALTYAIIDTFSDANADFSSFAPPSLQEFDLVCWNQGSADLSGLASCNVLNRINLSNVPVEDLSFLAGKQHVHVLSLNNMDKLRDISVLRGMNSLRDLYIYECWSIPDYSPVSECVYLESIQIDDRSGRLVDTSFLRGHPRLTDIRLYIDRMTDLDFLDGVGADNATISFHFAGTANDYSGLNAVKTYNWLSLDPNEENMRLLFSYLNEAQIFDLSLSRFRNVDLSGLPNVKHSIILDRCGNTDLSTLPDDLPITNIELRDCSALRSLEGIQNLKDLGADGTGTLRIYNCPLLSDWSALSGKKLYSLEITGGFSLPSFDDLRATGLRLDSIAEINDLSFLNDMDNSLSCNFELVGLAGAKTLSPLKRFHGSYIAVDPQLSELAQDLVDAGNFSELRIEYPDGGWELDLSGLELNSLEELDELPKSMLRRINHLNIAGDMVFNKEKLEIFEDWEHTDDGSVPLLYLKDRATGELMSVGPGSITDIGVFSDLSGLESLELYAQPLCDLNGIQSLSSLRSFSAQSCPDLTDISALFTLQDLESINLSSTPITSIQGIQNLTCLVDLTIDKTGVTDLSPLADCDFSKAYDIGGFSLSINKLEFTEGGLDALESIREYSSLAFCDQDPAVWMPLLKDSDIYRFGAAGDLRTDSDVAALASDHPELRSIFIGFSDSITDLTPLVKLEHLEYVTLNQSMEKAVSSLEGIDYGFELVIN